MPENSDGDTQHARHIVERLLSEESAGLDTDDNLVVSDIQKDAAEFSADLDLLERIGADVPALKIGDEYDEYLAPMSLAVFAGEQWPGYTFLRSRERRFSQFIHDWMSHLLESLHGPDLSHTAITTISRKKALWTFAERATDFLATRITAVKAFNTRRPKQPTPIMLNIFQRAGGPRVYTPGCHVSVSANSPGLRVFWSGAYRISSNYFNHPTTPTSSVLQSGTYVFGVDGGAYGNVIQWDTSAVISLPGTPQVHLNY